MTRARKNGIIVNIDWGSIANKPAVFVFSDVTYEALDANGDIGSGEGQLAIGNHDHEIGDVTLWFENQLL